MKRLSTYGNGIVEESMLEKDSADAMAQEDDPIFYLWIRTCRIKFFILKFQQQVIFRRGTLHRHHLAPPVDNARTF